MKKTTFEAYVRVLVYEKPTPEEIEEMYREVFLFAGEAKIEEFVSVMRRMRIPIPKGYATVRLG